MVLKKSLRPSGCLLYWPFVLWYRIRWYFFNLLGLIWLGSWSELENQLRSIYLKSQNNTNTRGFGASATRIAWLGRYATISDTNQIWWKFDAFPKKTLRSWMSSTLIDQISGLPLLPWLFIYGSNYTFYHGIKFPWEQVKKCSKIVCLSHCFSWQNDGKQKCTKNQKEYGS